MSIGLINSETNFANKIPSFLRTHESSILKRWISPSFYIKQLSLGAHLLKANFVANFYWKKNWIHACPFLWFWNRNKLLIFKDRSRHEDSNAMEITLSVYKDFSDFFTLHRGDLDPSLIFIMIVFWLSWLFLSVNLHLADNMFLYSPKILEVGQIWTNWI